MPEAGYVCVPLTARGEALGVLHLAGPRRRPGQGSLPGPDAGATLIQTIADHLGLALANLRLWETLRTQSIRDPLTGLYNRRYMEDSLEREIQRAARNHGTLGCVMFDLDHFKQFNDTFGHQAGDAVLRELGALVRSLTRGYDVVCRYGGEEFVWPSVADGTGSKWPPRSGPGPLGSAEHGALEWRTVQAIGRIPSQRMRLSPWR